MLFRDIYYQLKPALPWQLRLSFRRAWARRVRERYRYTWPISARSARPPAGWRGWPGGKQFALVLTHDIEGSAGLPFCRQVLEMEKDLGFRSSFNFVPEGEYTIPAALRHWVVEQGFEVGVHDLKHDGKLYWSRRSFESQAATINRYLKEWNAVGFRSAFMLHEIDWLHHLDIRYDASTFDTDPFEPQPDGVDTIFPFWVAGARGRGYVELPYTLVQDFTLFNVLQERGPKVWQQKLDWIAEHGGMALLDTHPDYMAFGNGRPDPRTYPVAYYREFLDYVSARFAGQFWHPLPREIAAYVTEMAVQEGAPGPPEDIAART